MEQVVDRMDMSGKKKKLLFLINTMEGGGAELVLSNVVNNLPVEKFDITVETVIDGGAFRKRLNGNIQYKSIVSCKNSLLRKVLIYAVSFVLPPRLVHRLFIGSRYDYEIAFLEGVPTKIISASENKKSIKYAWVHIDLYNTFGLDKVYRSLNAHIRCYKKFNNIICVSETVKRAFIRRFGYFSNLKVIYNVIDDDAIRNSVSENDKENDIVSIVSVGRLEEQKGFDRLLIIIKRLIDEGYKCTLKIVGDGSKREEYQAFIEQNKLDEYVKLMGFVSNPYQYMKNADLLVFPSRAEGYSTVVTEAIILGKPVVVSNCSGMKEILGDSEYGVVTENNIEALYNGIKKMLDNAKLRAYYTMQARERSKDFKKSVKMKKIEELFR